MHERAGESRCPLGRLEAIVEELRWVEQTLLESE